MKSSGAYPWNRANARAEAQRGPLKMHRTQLENNQANGPHPCSKPVGNVSTAFQYKLTDALHFASPKQTTERSCRIVRQGAVRSARMRTAFESGGRGVFSVSCTTYGSTTNANRLDRTPGSTPLCHSLSPWLWWCGANRSKTGGEGCR